MMPCGQSRLRGNSTSHMHQPLSIGSATRSLGRASSKLLPQLLATSSAASSRRCSLDLRRTSRNFMSAPPSSRSWRRAAPETRKSAHCQMWRACVGAHSRGLARASTQSPHELLGKSWARKEGGFEFIISPVAPLAYAWSLLRRDCVPPKPAEIPFCYSHPYTEYRAEYLDPHRPTHPHDEGGRTVDYTLYTYRRERNPLSHSLTARCLRHTTHELT